MLQELREQIRSLVTEARNPVLLCSFGKESMLLLYLIREVKDIPVIWFHDHLTKEQREFPERVIIDWNLTALNYPANDYYFVPCEDSVSIVSEYGIGGTVRTIRDFYHAETCSLDIFKARPGVFEYTFDLTLTGSRSTDSHPIGGENPFPRDIEFASSRLVAPLRDLTENQVWDAILELGVPYDEQRYAGDEERDPSNVHACTKCVTHSGAVYCPKVKRQIDSVVWDKDASLEAFRGRLNVGAK